MKSLVKVRIINWHYFYNVTFDLGQVNFLTGQNAAGKSTLIDAMQVVLLGDTSGRQFNKAANEKSGRTLKGYLKGEIGDDGEGSFKYLRNGRFSSYIVLEWYDDLMDHSFCTGIVFDVFEDSTEEHHFFTLEDKMPANDFTLLQVPMSYKQLLDYFQMNYKPSDYFFAETNAQYQEKIKDEFGGIKDKYFSLFKKAVSFTPITNIEQFLTEYVCDVPGEINVESMRNNIQQYKRLEIEAENMQQKIKALTEIHSYYEEYKKKKVEQDLDFYISKRVHYQMSLNAIALLQNNVTSCENTIAEIDKDIADIDEKLKQMKEKKENLIAQKVASGSYQLTKELQQEKEAKINKISHIEENLKTIKNNFSSYLNNYEKSANNILLLATQIKDNRIYMNYKQDIDCLIQCANDLLDSSEAFKANFNDENNINAEAVVNFRNSMSTFKSKVLEISTNLNGSLSTLILRHNASKQQIADMEKGSKMYDYALVTIRNELQIHLSDYFHKDVKVFFFADLIDIKNKRWLNAIEGFIYNQKLNMFVEDEYYEVANRILPKIMESHNYYRTGLVDAEKLINANFKMDVNSLAEEIDTGHDGARAYSNYLLGKMIKCETFAEARQCGRGITPECTGYRSYASFVIPKNHYQYPLIGRKISKEAMEIKALEVKNNEGLITVLKTLVGTLNYVNNLEVMTSYEADNAKEILLDGEMLPGLRESLASISEELENSGSVEISSIDAKIAKLDDDIKDLESDKARLAMDKGGANQNIRQIQEEKIPQEISKSEELLKAINETFDKDFIENVGIVKFEEELASGKSLVSIGAEYESAFIKLQSRIKNEFYKFNEIRKDYCLNYKLSYDYTRETNEEFDNELTLLRDVKLPSYQEKITDAYNKATKEFKDDFIYKLKTCIETVRGQIEELNEALKDAQFGQDSYQFVVSAAPEYKDYYDMITDNLLLSVDNEEEYFTKYHEVMNNLFKLIGDVSNSKDQNSVLEQNVVKFTDYRTYLMFDMLVKKGEGKSYSLAKNIKKQSGGETQTPFYVSILASFSQLYRIRKPGAMGNCIRLVVFDEAFSKMDATRIIESIKILKNFGLQVILSAPSDKVSDLSKIVDKTLLVNRQNSRSFVDLFEIKK